MEKILTQRQKDSLKKTTTKKKQKQKTPKKTFFKNFELFNFRMKWVVLPYSESFSEETKCIEVKS